MGKVNDELLNDAITALELFNDFDLYEEDFLKDKLSKSKVSNMISDLKSIRYQRLKKYYFDKELKIFSKKLKEVIKEVIIQEVM